MWQGDLGFGWAHTFGYTLWPETEGGMFRGPDGRRIPFSFPMPKKPVVLPADRISFHHFAAEELPWDKLRSDLSQGTYVVQPGADYTLFFDTRTLNGVFPLPGHRGSLL